jgi:hypothetical protein
MLVPAYKIVRYHNSLQFQREIWKHYTEKVSHDSLSQDNLLPSVKAHSTQWKRLTSDTRTAYKKARVHKISGLKLFRGLK